MKKILLGSVLATFAFALLLATPAKADTVNVNFESPTYTVGNINGQNGWSSTGAYDQAVVNSPVISGSQSFRISNAKTSGSFGDQTFSKSLTDEAGETTAQSSSYSGGTRQNHFEAQFDIKSAVASEQRGLSMSVSPDRGDGARMGYVRFDDKSDGIHVYFDDYKDVSPYGSLSIPSNGCGTGDDWVETDIATLDHTTSHTIKITMDFVNGQRNDIVRVFVDGVLKKTGTSWEDYFRWCTESGGGVVNGTTQDVSRTVDSLLFRVGGTAAPGTSGNGYLIDNLSLLSGARVVAHGAITSPVNEGDHVSGTLNLSATYDDGDVPNNDDGVQWAVRKGTCAAGVGTVLGNVDGHNDVATWDGNNFSFTKDVSAFTPGNYCFVFNPTDDAGQPDIRLTRNFVIYAPTQTSVKVTIAKFIGDQHATAGNANNALFPMTATWNAINIGSGSGSFNLGPTGFNNATPYEATTADMTSGASYKVQENLSTTCGDGGFALVGYSVGNTLDTAADKDPSPDFPDLTNITSDKFIIVWNKTCPTVKVTIDKYIDGKMATVDSANNKSFPMTATWATTNIPSETGNYSLGPVGFNSSNPYEAITANMNSGADYKTNEVTNENVVGASCTDLKPFALVGYTTGDTLEKAAAATPSATTPNFDGLQSDKFVIVWNKSCVVPTLKDQCKKDGWKTLVDDLGRSFKNQGDCVSFVATKGKNKAAGQ